jgi:hypothetical protein
MNPKLWAAVLLACALACNESKKPKAADGLSPEMLAQIELASAMQAQAAAIQKAIESKGVGITGLEVAVAGDTAVLSGFAKSKEDKDAAGTVAAALAPKRNVENAIAIKP